MKNITIYDTDFEFFEDLADQEDTTVAEVVADVVSDYLVHLKGEKA